MLNAPMTWGFREEWSDIGISCDSCFGTDFDGGRFCNDKSVAISRYMIIDSSRDSLEYR